MTSHADPQKTYALVVGIEQYAAGASWNTLDGPVPDARRFADWLLSRGVPPTNIMLLLSPRPSNQGLLTTGAPEAMRATHQAIKAALYNNLNSKRGDLLLVFWSGHGMITADGDRRLFYADATQADPLNLDLNNLLTVLRTSTFAGFSRQMCIIDACANYMKFDIGALPHEQLAYGKPRRDCEQFVLTGAKAGDVAINLVQQQTGIFARTILELLETEPPDQWPPAMIPLTSQLQERFTLLRNEKKTGQTPNYFWYQDWQGNTGTLGNPSIASHAPDSPADPHGLSVDEKMRLRDALLACKAMNNRNRETILEQLRSEIWQNIRHNDTPSFHVFHAVEACLDYNGGIGELIHVIKAFEQNSETLQRLQAVAADLGFAVNQG